MWSELLLPYWDVGDTKTIVINGKVGNTTFSNLSIDAFIVGFNHNSSREGANRIHFQLGKIGGKMVGLIDSNYNSSSSSSGYFQMNTSNTNSGGWNGSYMRKTLLGNSNTPTSPLANSLMAALPADLRAVMKSVTKYTDNTGNASNSSANVTATTDYLWLLAEFEVQGARSYANQYEQNYQQQYAYYSAGNSKVAYRHSATGIINDPEEEDPESPDGDVITAERGMEYVYGQKYLDPEDSNVYICKRIGEADGGKVTLQFLPHELVGQYFELAN